KAIEIEPGNHEAHSYRGLAYRFKGAYAEAISDFSKVIGLNPHEVSGYLLRADVYFRNSEHDLAVDDCSKAIALKAKGSYDEAISDYDKAIELNRGRGESYVGRGYARYAKREYDKAWDDVDMAASLGHQVDPEFLKNLREASGRKE
ncbi:MAG: tetratricopeptide repeat protein, partial [Deltaproteobacteria bacterium]|nr:tetratricopeptide repeat protein [Deltaproteobacteria bacterium]